METFCNGGAERLSNYHSVQIQPSITTAKKIQRQVPANEEYWIGGSWDQRSLLIGLELVGISFLEVARLLLISFTRLEFSYF